MTRAVFKVARPEGPSGGAKETRLSSIRPTPAAVRFRRQSAPLCPRFPALRGAEAAALGVSRPVSIAKGGWEEKDDN